LHLNVVSTRCRSADDTQDQEKHPYTRKQSANGAHILRTFKAETRTHHLYRVKLPINNHCNDLHGRGRLPKYRKDVQADAIVGARAPPPLRRLSRQWPSNQMRITSGDR